MSNLVFHMEEILFSGFRTSASGEFRNYGEPNIAIIWDAGLVSLVGFAG